MKSLNLDLFKLSKGSGVLFLSIGIWGSDSWLFVDSTCDSHNWRSYIVCSNCTYEGLNVLYRGWDPDILIGVLLGVYKLSGRDTVGREQVLK